MITVEGRDPGTGQVLELGLEGQTVISIERRGPTADSTMPYVAAGLIDLQVNGYAGHDINGPDVNVDDLAGITAALAARGVTSWVPTIVTASTERILHALEVIGRARRDRPEVAAAVPFAHVEGPFISDRDGPRGVHDAQHIRPIDAHEVARWAASGVLGYVTVSPHWPDSPTHIAAIRAQGVGVAVGHTHAAPEQIRAAVDAGASLSTHLGNGIALELPRHPNAIWTQLAEDRLACGFVADGHHLPEDTLVAMLRAKGTQRSFLVSDSVALAGSPPGRYRQSVGGDVELDAGGRLSYAGSEMLAGSAVSNADCLRYVIAHCGYSLAQALPLVTSVPGNMLGQHRGLLEVGARADLLLVDSGGTVHGVFQGGEEIEPASEPRP